jgi:hypothetical protein
MTIARDIQTGAVVGQYLGEYAQNADNVLVPTFHNLRGDFVRVLSAKGYSFLPSRSVSLEKVA